MNYQTENSVKSKGDVSASVLNISQFDQFEKEVMMKLVAQYGAEFSGNVSQAMSLKTDRRGSVPQLRGKRLNKGRIKSRDLSSSNFGKN